MKKRPILTLTFGFSDPGFNSLDTLGFRSVSDSLKKFTFSPSLTISYVFGSFNPDFSGDFSFLISSLNSKSGVSAEPISFLLDVKEGVNEVVVAVLFTDGALDSLDSEGLFSLSLLLVFSLASFSLARFSLASFTFFF